MYYDKCPDHSLLLDKVEILQENIHHLQSDLKFVKYMLVAIICSVFGAGAIL